MDHEPSKYSSSLFYESLNKKWIVDILYWTRLLHPDPSQVVADWSVGQPLPKRLFTFYSQKDQNVFCKKSCPNRLIQVFSPLENVKSVLITTLHTNQLQKCFWGIIQKGGDFWRRKQPQILQTLSSFAKKIKQLINYLSQKWVRWVLFVNNLKSFKPLEALGSECAQFVDLECWWCLWPKASFWDNFRQIIAGSKAVVVRTALPPVLDVKKLPVRPNRPDLRPSLSRTTLPFMWVRISAVCDRNCRIKGHRGWNSLASCVGCEEAACPAESSGFKAVMVKNNLALRVGPDLRCMWLKLPDRRPSWSEQPCLLCRMWRSSLSGRIFRI